MATKMFLHPESFFSQKELNCNANVIYMLTTWIIMSHWWHGTYYILTSQCPTCVWLHKWLLTIWNMRETKCFAKVASTTARTLVTMFLRFSSWIISPMKLSMWLDSYHLKSCHMAHQLMTGGGLFSWSVSSSYLSSLPFSTMSATIGPLVTRTPSIVPVQGWHVAYSACLSTWLHC